MKSQVPYRAGLKLTNHSWFQHQVGFLKSSIKCIKRCMKMCSDAQPCPTLCDPMDCNLPGSSVHRISQARILEWDAMPSSRGSSWPSDRTWMCWVSCVAGGFFTTEPPGKPDVWKDIPQMVMVAVLGGWDFRRLLLLSLFFYIYCSNVLW